jgi:hypothetical protein
MAYSITLTFSAPLNESCQVGDMAYYIDPATSGGFSTDDGTGPKLIGQIRQINNANSSTPSIICETILAGSFNEVSKFILFSKDNKANQNNALGYFAEMKLRNSSTGIENGIHEKIELFSVGVDIFESSK